MREGWRRCFIGDVVRQESATVGLAAGVKYPIVGVLNFGRGLLRRSSLTSDQTSYRRLNSVGPSRLIYSKLKAFEGAVTVTPRDLPLSYASSEFPTFSCDDDLDSEYLRLLTRYPPFWEDLAGRSRGMGGRRERLDPQHFLALPILLPPVREQRRIADLVASVERASAVAEAALKIKTDCHAQLRRAMLAKLATSPISELGEVAEVQLGRMLSKDRTAGVAQAPYIRNANVQWSGLDLTDLKSMSFPQDVRDRYALRAGDILACEGGDPGRCVLLTADLPGIYYQKAVHRVRTGHQLIPSFLYECLAEAHYSGRILDLCTSTTIAHLTAEKFRRLKVPIPELGEQMHITDTLSVSGRSITILRDLANDLQTLRLNLLTALLSGEHEIPESYDELMGA